MPVSQSLRVELQDATSVGAARRACEELAVLSSLGEAQRGRLSLIVTEAANNAIRYAQQGEIVLRRMAHAVDVLVLDKGPGMLNLERCMEDGYSTGGTRGVGLGSLNRQADVFAIHSQAGRGTGIFARVGEASDTVEATVGAVCLPVGGESECGDSWRVSQLSDCIRVALADGLGHGPKAAEAARAVLEAIDDDAQQTPYDLLARMHDAASSTRGAAVAIADVPLRGDAQLAFTGVGNIGGSLLGRAGTSHSLPSHNGTVGSRMPRTQTFSYPWPADDAMLVMYSDGLQSRWSLDAYPGMAQQHPTLVAGILYRDFARGRDDVTVVVLKKGGS